MEEQAEYETGNTKDVIVFTCPNPECGVPLGVFLTLPNGQQWLQVGGIIMRNFNGSCSKCGTHIYWSVADRMLEKLIKYMIRMQQSQV